MSEQTLSVPHSSQEKSRGFVAYIRAHPLLLLLLLSPGIPEYLSGSSSWALLILNPPLFLLLLAFNIGLYFTGVVLVREAVIRWRRGWASVFLLGFAYAIVEEGLALRTLYNPDAPQVGSLGIYGHWLGVNWVWTVGLLIFHSAFSVALPILLFGLAFPALKSTSLVSPKRLGMCLVVLAADSAVLSGVANYDPGPAILLSSFLFVLVFTIAGRIIPAGLLRPSSSLPRRRPLTIAMIGITFFPSVLVGGGLMAGANAPPWATALLEIAFSVALVLAVFRNIGRQNNQTHKTALSIGLIVPVVCFGIISSLSSIPLIIVVDIAFLFFLRRLWRKYPLRPATGPSLTTMSRGRVESP